MEQRHWDDALAELQKALDLDPRRFAPFPLDKLIPSRILGAGGFGVAYLCRHRYMKTDVVVKSLFDETLEPDVLFTEAQVLRQLNHPAIVRIQDCGFACPDEKRPYIVMDYFEGQTLEDQAREKALEVEELYQIALLMIDGLQAAHDSRILNRDLKPANFIVQKQGEQWDARLIDFGLALDRSMHETLGATAHTLVGSSIAGTLDYASPEQMGKLPGVGVTAASDIYGFARTCCYALFQTPLPLPRHWRRIPEKLADVLEWCLEDHPDKRPQSFEEVKKRIQELSPTSQTVAVPIPTPKEEKSEAKPTEDANGRQELEMLAREVCQCTQCDQLAKTRTSTVFGAGPVPADICFIGEAPGADEDREGEPFIGQAGQLLDRIISAMGLKREDVYICNILKCRPPRNRTPLPTEAANCRGYLEKQLEIVKPKVIVALGGSAAQNLLGVTQTIGRLRRQVHRYKDTPVICTYHPAFLLPSRSPEKKRDVWDDMQLVLRQLEK